MEPAAERVRRINGDTFRRGPLNRAATGSSSSDGSTMKHATTRRVAFGIAAVVTALAIVLGRPLHLLLGAPGWRVLSVLDRAQYKVPTPFASSLTFESAVALAAVVNVLVWWVSTYGVLRIPLWVARRARTRR